MTHDPRHPAPESPRERVHRLASLGGLVVLAGLDRLPPDLLLGVLLEVGDRLPSLGDVRCDAIARAGSAAACAPGRRRSARGPCIANTPTCIVWSSGPKSSTRSCVPWDAGLPSIRRRLSLRSSRRSAAGPSAAPGSDRGRDPAQRFPHDAGPPAAAQAREPSAECASAAPELRAIRKDPAPDRERPACTPGLPGSLAVGAPAERREGPLRAEPRRLRLARHTAGTWPAREHSRRDVPAKVSTPARREIDIADRLGAWQRAGDPRLWKLIVSPEAGERLDLRQHARDLVAAMEGDLGLRLDWVGIEHYDTAHPHVHVVIRGRSQEGVVFRMPREYVGRGIRLRSQELAHPGAGAAERTRSRGRAGARRLGATLRRARSDARAPCGRLAEDRVRAVDPERRRVADAAAPAPPAARVPRDARSRASASASARFELSEHHRAALEQMQLARDLQRSLTRYGETLVDPDAPLRFTRAPPRHPPSRPDRGWRGGRGAGRALPPRRGNRRRSPRRARRRRRSWTTASAESLDAGRSSRSAPRRRRREVRALSRSRSRDTAACPSSGR